MKIGLCVFPSFLDNHYENKSSIELGQRLEPSVLYLASERSEDSNVFIPLNDFEQANNCDLILCSVYTRGWEEFKKFSRRIGRHRIIAGGYHPTAMPEQTLRYARLVVTGLTSNIEDLLGLTGIVRGKPGWRKMHRELLGELQSKMTQVYPDVYPAMLTGRSTSSVGCPYDCDFCSTPLLSDRHMTIFSSTQVREEVQDLKERRIKVVFLSDESFATRSNFKETAEAYAAGGFEVLYSFGTAAALNDYKMGILKECGWHSLNLGLEEINTVYKKNSKLSQAAKLCRDYGIMLNLSFIINDFGKTKEEALKDYWALYDAFIDLCPGMVAANFMMPFPGTGIWPKYKSYVDENDYVKFDSKTPIFSGGVLADWHKHMAVALQLAYYYSPEYKDIRTFECGDNLHLRFEELKTQFGMENDGWLEWMNPKERPEKGKELFSICH